MREVFWLIPNRLAGRSGPTQVAWSLSEIRTVGGFDTVLNLSEHPPQPLEFRAVELACYWVPLPTTVPPDDDAEASCYRGLSLAYEIVADHLAANRRVLVHCVAGRDRTGLLLSYFLARTHQLTPIDAIARVRQTQPMALSAPGWEDMGMRVIRALTAGSAGQTRE